MKIYSRDLSQLISKAVKELTEAIHKAVPAVASRQVMPRWRNLGQRVTPYHFMQPALVPVKQNRKG